MPLRWGGQAGEKTIGYEERLFDRSRVHTLDIVTDDWEELLENATSETYYSCAVVIDGESYKNVGIRGKGNTSLSSVAQNRPRGKSRSVVSLLYRTRYGKLFSDV